MLARVLSTVTAPRVTPRQGEPDGGWAAPDPATALSRARTDGADPDDRPGEAVPAEATEATEPA